MGLLGFFDVVSLILALVLAVAQLTIATHTCLLLIHSFPFLGAQHATNQKLHMRSLLLAYVMR